MLDSFANVLPGMKLLVRNDLYPYNLYDDCRFDEEMSCYCGEVVTVLEVLSDIRLHIEHDVEYWYWSPAMFECIVSDEDDADLFDILVKGR